MTFAIERPGQQNVDTELLDRKPFPSDDVFIHVDLYDEEPVTGPDVPEADETCRRCGTNTNVVYTGETTETIAGLGEKPGRKHCWHCSSCKREWTTPAGQLMSCPEGLSWCARHETDSAGEEYHGGNYTEVDADRSGPREDTTERLLVTCSRSDVNKMVGEPRVYLLPGDFRSEVLHDALGFTPAAARALADALTAAADAVESRPLRPCGNLHKVRTSKPAADLRLGDRVVIGSQVHEVIMLLVDSRCCPEGCEGSVQIYTDRSEAVDESEPAATFNADELVDMAISAVMS